MAAINRGDEDAFAALYYRHRDWVVRLAHRFTGNAADDLDVLQETFAYILRKVPSLHLTASFTTFLYPVVKNLSIAARRKRGRFRGNEEALDQVPAPRTGLLDSASAEFVEALTILGEIHREVLLMRFVDGLSLEEISMALGIPLGTVKSRLHNALETLRHDERTQKLFS